jgi:PAS domain S-box-containing protein
MTADCRISNNRFISFPQFRVRACGKFLRCICLVVLGLSAVIYPARADEVRKRIFLLEGLTPTQPAAVETIHAIKQRFTQRAPKSIDLFTEFLDLGRFNGPESEDRLLQFLRARFEQTPPDLILPISRGATLFMARHRDDVAKNVPIVYCCTPMSATETLSLPADMPGIVVDYDWAGTLALAERLQPNARTLVIVSGPSRLGRVWLRDAIAGLQPYLKKYRTTYLVGFAHNEVLKEVSRLPRDSIVILMPFFEDGSDVPSEVASEIAKMSSAPAYSPVTTLFGGSIVGGRMDSYSSQGIKVADLALEVLSGKDPSKIPHQTKLPLRYRVDARALQRWALSESVLPSGTVVEFNRPTVWTEYRDVILVALLTFALQGGIITMLLMQKHKRRAAEKLLQETEDRMAFAAASVNIGIWRMELPSGQLWATEHCRSMFGIDADAPLTWEDFRNAVHPEDRQIFDQWVKSLLPSPRLRRTEFRVQSSVHSPRWYLSRQYAVSDCNGQPLQICGVFADVTERKLAEEQTQTQREELAHMMRVSAVGELSGGLAHELSQPLAAILANAQAAQTVLARRNQGDDLFAEIVDDVVREVDRATQVVHGLRRLLKKGKCESSPASLNDLVTSTFALIHSELVKRRIRIETELERDLPPIFCDRVQIQQVILNLMTNAMDAMGSTPAQSRLLRVATRTAEGGGVELSVLDRGPGLSSDEFKQLFQPFFTTKPHGLGLGLSICSTIVKSHRGRLDIANAKGEGTIAVVWLPSSVQLARAS